MAEGKMHFAPVLALDTGDFVVIGDKVVEVDNTPRDDVDGAFLSVQGTTFSHRADNWKRVSARFSTNAMIPRLDDDFNLEAYTIDDGRVIELDRWPDEPVIYVDLGQGHRGGAHPGCPAGTAGRRGERDREPRSPGSALGLPGPGVVRGHPRRRSGVITPHGRPVDRGEDRPAPGLALTQRPSNGQRPGSQGERHAPGPPRWRDRLRGTAHPELRPAGRCAQASHVHPAAR